MNLSILIDRYIRFSLKENYITAKKSTSSYNRTSLIDKLDENLSTLFSKIKTLLENSNTQSLTECQENLEQKIISLNDDEDMNFETKYYLDYYNYFLAELKVAIYKSKEQPKSI